MTQFRTATLSDLRIILSWAAQEGWNPGIEDAKALYAADPNGFFVAVEDHQPVAAISVVNHSEAFAFLGLYIVRPAFRGFGIGFGLWAHGIEHAGLRTIGLDGVPEQQENYMRSGFKKSGKTTRFVGSVVPKVCSTVRMTCPQDIPQLVNLEASASGQNKRNYLSEWFIPSSTRKTLVLTENHDVVGLCTIRQCEVGTKIGPLVCNTKEQSECLIRHAVTVFEGDVMIDVPEQSTELTELCIEQGLLPTFETARMYRGDASPILARSCLNYAVASLELG